MKLFNVRSLLKEKIHSQFQEKDFLESFYVNQKEIRYCHLGANIGYEEDGKGEEYRRPVLVLKKVGILYRVLPLTSRAKEESKFYHIIDNTSLFYYKSTAQVKKSGVILSQGKMIDKTRFMYKVADISENEFSLIIKKLKTLLF